MARWVTTGFQGSVGALALSLGGHVMALFILPRGSEMAVRATESRVDIVEFVVQPPPPEPVAPEPPPSARIPRSITPRPPSPPDPPEIAPPATPATTPPEVTPPPEVPSVTPPTVIPQPTGVRPTLDARAAARSVLAVEGPRMPRAATVAIVEGETDAARDRRIETELNGALTTAANARPWGRGRELPDPVRRPDGTMAYPLGQVTAIVNPDGSFTFDDTSGVQFGGMGNSQREGMQVGWGLEEWMMRRHGDDPHAATRRWFANQTESMRDSMAERYVERQAASAARGMRGRLTRMLSDESTPIEERRRRIFAFWDDCAENELVGDAVRAAIVSFVRDSLARGTPNAFTDAELDAWNRTRESAAEFRPYAP